LVVFFWGYDCRCSEAVSLTFPNHCAAILVVFFWGYDCRCSMSFPMIRIGFKTPSSARWLRCPAD
jgi:hypothetical protein